ncbi:MAG: hypothetical protein M0R48_10135 [Candidatus Omnitrophica bacterium]|nr:hypothetical protein [Candidatus Omnitrophota bacterium]
MNNEFSLKLYVVRNSAGKYFRNKGFGGNGDVWVDDINRAKIYLRIGPAKSVVPFWAGHYPKYGIPDIIELKVTESVVLNQEVRFGKLVAANEKREAKKEEQNRKQKLSEAKKDYERTLIKYLERFNNEPETGKN